MGAPNIVMVVLDTVRARELSCYGYSRQTTPNLESMDLVRFHNAFSPSYATVPSHASLFTGAYCSIHQTNADNKILNPELTTLAKKLSENGYRTIGFSNNIHVSSMFEFDRGFDELVFNKGAYGEPFGGVSLQLMRQHAGSNRTTRQALEMIKYVRESEGSLSRTAASWVYKKATEMGVIDRGDRGAKKALSFLETNLPVNEEPFFMFFNLMEGHMPFLAPEEHLLRFDPNIERNVWGEYEQLHEQTLPDSDRIVENLQDKYDGCISYLDETVARMVDFLRESGVLDETYLFILSDHGEGFGEHGIYGHTGGLYNEITRVPLLVRPPGGGSDVIDYPVSIQWIMPTILRETGINTPDRCVDQHLFNQPEIPVIFESSGLGVDADHPDIDRFFEQMVGGVNNGQKLIKGKTWQEVYALSDRNETDPLSFKNNIDELVKSEFEAYEPTERSADYSDRDLSAEAQAQLRKLGYID
jgi:arylsulfatase A-like enzyme